MIHWWANEKIWKGKITKPVSHNYKISICTTCMDRLEDLSQTLPFNLECETYPLVEFVLVDYNSTKQNVSKWAEEKLKKHIDSGKLKFYRTSEPKFYNMSHSRNIAFRVAEGDIVLNVDADNRIIGDKYRPKATFASYINMLANEAEGKNAVFIKGQPLRGRAGFFKNEFINIGGYDEEMENYGYEDVDIIKRFWRMGATAYAFGGQYVGRIPTPSIKKGENMKNKNWRRTEIENKLQSEKKIKNGQLVRNENKEWGKACLLKNFSETVYCGCKKKENTIML